MRTEHDQRSLGRLIADAIQQTGDLVGTEVKLAQEELSQKFQQGIAGLAFLFGAATFLSPVITILLIALATVLMDFGVRDAAAYFIVACVGAIVVAIFAFVGAKRLQNLRPKETIGQLKKDMNAAKGLSS
jgi:hypothetical protein